MNSSLKKPSDSPKPRYYNKIVGFIGFVAILLSVFTLQNNSQAVSASTKEKGKKVTTLPASIEVGPVAVDKSRLKRVRDIAADAEPIEPNTQVIPSGITPNNVAFYGIDLDSSVRAQADTNNDRIPDDDATERFLASDDANTEIVSAFTINKKNNKTYTGVMSAGGARQGMSEIFVADIGPGYIGLRRGRFDTGKGQVFGMSVLNTAKGDVLLVGTLFFEKGITDLGATDNLTVTAYPLGDDGMPQGTPKVVLAPGALKLGANTINLTIGGFAVDNKGNLYLNAASKFLNSDKQVRIDGAIVVFTDSDGDGIPDKPDVFAGRTQADANAPLFASSMTAFSDANGPQLAVLSNEDPFGGRTKIVIYSDADGDLKADGAPKLFFNNDPQTLRTLFFDFFSDQDPDSAGVSTFESASMGFADGVALINFAKFNAAGNALADSGIAIIRAGVTTAPPRVFQAPRAGTAFGSVVFVFNAPNTADTTPPTVKVTAPNGGEMVMGGTQLNITFTSTDDKAVMSHDIALSTDGGTTFPTVVAAGLPGTTQTFAFPVPPNIDTKTARIRVTAKDAGGNAASDSSDANFTIIKANTTDSMPPTVTITSPKSGDSLNGGTMATVSFSSTDNVGVGSHNVLFSTDGTNFTTTLAAGLPGTATSFSFRVPAINSTTAAIRVEALDTSNNKAAATVSQLKVVTDTTAPTVTVTSPSASTKKIVGNTAFMVTFTSTDNVGVASHDVQISLDGTNFTTVASGLPGTATSAMVTIPNMKAKASVIRVIAKDAAGNMGSGNSAAFKIKPKK